MPNSPLSCVYICPKLVLSLSSTCTTIPISAFYNQTMAQCGSTVRWVHDSARLKVLSGSSFSVLHALRKSALTSKRAILLRAKRESESRGESWREYLVDTFRGRVNLIATASDQNTLTTQVQMLDKYLMLLIQYFRKHHWKCYLFSSLPLHLRIFLFFSFLFFCDFFISLQIFPWGCVHSPKKFFFFLEYFCLVLDFPSLAKKEHPWAAQSSETRYKSSLHFRRSAGTAQASNKD